MAEPQIEAFLRYAVEGLVDHPEEVSILRSQHSRKQHVYMVRLHPEDLGKVIGKQGQTITALRNLLNSAAERLGQEAVLELMEDSGRQH